MTGEIDRTIVQPAADAGRDRGLRRLLLVGVALLLVPMAFLAFQYFSQHGEITELQQTSDSRAADVGRLAQQVKSLGATPVVQPPPAAPAAVSVAVDPDVLRAAARSAVEDYCSARDECRGANGETPDFDALTNAVLARIPVPKDGAPGKDAPTPDVAGAVAAYCGQDTDPCRGSDGTKGDTGDTGATGATGAPGPACPDGYQLADATIETPDGPRPGKACVDPTAGIPPSQPEPPTGG
ncbi:hypothetical protein VSH64_24805 [Amycolatopsis rhabdoformis]|uniref:Collagen-like protein n=1 Tax=Amycolatopsis rhabdoformis TaxID=1448059 RepID=A0ABZ1HUY3_9PSEU|nr:hypothetical protein [Amycolatopsis rhabdoformis]WSE26098.1 hypothetical protein VSH64_24805 [Amycolatopsis rhabdoformis]